MSTSATGVRSPEMYRSLSQTVFKLVTMLNGIISQPS